MAGPADADPSSPIGPSDTQDPNPAFQPKVVPPDPGSISAIRPEATRSHWVKENLLKTLGPNLAAQLGPVMLDRMVENLQRGMAARQPNASGGLPKLVENIARTLDRTATSSSGQEHPSQSQLDRTTLAQRLHELAALGDVQAEREAVSALRMLIQDIESLRQRNSVLEDTSVNAYSALNATEHQLADLRVEYEHLFALMARRAAAVDPALRDLLLDRRAERAARLAGAEQLLSFLPTGANSPANAPSTSADQLLVRRISELEAELAQYHHAGLSGSHRLRSSTFDPVAQAARSQEDLAAIQAQLAQRSQALAEAQAQLVELRQQLTASSAVASPAAWEELQKTLLAREEELRQFREQHPLRESTDVVLLSDTDALRQDRFERAEKHRELALLTTEVHRLEAALAQEQALRQALAQQLQAAEAALVQAQVGAADLASAEQERLRSRIQELDHQLADRITELEGLRQEHEALIIQHTQAAAGAEAASAEVEHLLAERKDLLARREADDASKTLIESRLTQFQQQVEDLQQQLDRQSAQHQQQLAATAAELAARQDECSQTRQRLAELEVQLAATAVELAARQDECSQARQRLAELEVRFAAAAEDHAGVVQQLDAATARLAVAQEQQTALVAQLEEAATRTKDLEARLVAASAHSGQEAELLHQELATLRQDLTEAIVDRTRLSEELEQTRQVRDRQSHDLTAQQTELASFERRATEAERLQDAAVQRVHQLETAIGEWRAQSQRTRIELDELRGRLTTAEQTAQADSQTRNQLVSHEAELGRQLAARDQTVTTLAAERDRAVVQAQTLAGERDLAAAQVQALRTERDTLAGERDLAAAQVQSLSHTQDQLRNRIQELDAALGHTTLGQDELRQKYESCLRERDDLVKRLTSAEGRLAAAEQERAALRVTCEDQAAEQGRATTQLEDARAEIQALLVEREELSTQVRACESRLRELAEHCASQDSAAEATARVLAQAHRDLEQAQIAGRTAQEQAGRTEERLRSLTTELESLRDREVQLAAAVDRQAGELAQARERLAAAAEAAGRQAELLAQGENRLSASQEQVAALEGRLRQAAAERDDALSMRAAELAESNAARAELGSQLGALEAALARAKDEAHRTSIALHQQIDRMEEERLIESREAAQRLRELGDETVALAAARDHALDRTQALADLLARLWPVGQQLLRQQLDLAAALAAADPAAADAQGDLAAAHTELAQRATEGWAEDPPVAEEVLAPWTAASQVFGTLVLLAIEAIETRRQLAADHATLQRDLDQAQGRIAQLHGDQAVATEQLALRQQELTTLRAALEEQTQRGMALASDLAAAQAQLAASAQALEQAQDAARRQAETTAAEQAAETDTRNALEERCAALDQNLSITRAGWEDARTRLEVWTSQMARLLEAFEPVTVAAGLDPQEGTDLADELEASPHEPRPELIEEATAAVLATGQAALSRLHELTGQAKAAAARIQALEAGRTQLEGQRDELTQDLARLTGQAEGLGRELLSLRDELAQTQTVATARGTELAALRQRECGLASDLTAAQHANEHLRGKLEEAVRVQAELAETRRQLEALQRRHEQANTAGRELITALKGLGLHSNERFDRLGLLSPGDSRRYTHTTMRLDRAEAEGQSLLAAEYGKSLVARIADHLSAFADTLVGTRQERDRAESQIAHLREVVAEKDRQQTQLAGRLSALEPLPAQLAASQAECERLTSGLAALEARLHAAAVAKDRELRALKAEAEGMKAEFEETITQLRQEVDAASARQAALSQEKQTLEAQVDQLVESLQAERAGATQRQTDLQRNLDELAAANQAFHDELDRLKAARVETLGLEGRIKHLSDRLATANRDNLRLSEELRQVRREREDSAAVRGSLGELGRRVDEAERRAAGLERQLAAEKARSASLAAARRSHHSGLAGQLAILRQAEQEAQRQLESLRSDNRHLSQELVTLRNRLPSASPHPRKPS